MTTQNKGSLSAYAIAVAGAFLIVAVLVSVLKSYTQPPPLNKARVLERHKALAEVNAAAQAEVNAYARIDATKDLYRLKVSQAMSLTEQLYQNPAAGRSNLILRAEKANFVPPPPTFE